MNIEKLASLVQRTFKSNIVFYIDNQSLSFIFNVKKIDSYALKKINEIDFIREYFLLCFSFKRESLVLT